MEQIAEAHATVSQSVRAFYERMPYPPPVADLDALRALCSDPTRRRALFHQAWPAQTQREDYEILVAGCGTSQAVRYAFREPGARITAIDVSEASLLHTRHSTPAPLLKLRQVDPFVLAQRLARHPVNRADNVA